MAVTDAPLDAADLTQREEQVMQEHDFLDHVRCGRWGEARSLLRTSRGLVHAQPCGRWPALHEACSKGNAAVARQLLELGADAVAVTRSGETCEGLAEGEAREVLLAAATAGPDRAAPHDAATPQKRCEVAAALSPPKEKPPSKRARRAAHAMNVQKAIAADFRHGSLGELREAPVSALAALSVEGRAFLRRLCVRNIRQLGQWKFFKMAKGITGLHSLEAMGERGKGSTLNINEAMDKVHEKQSLRSIATMPPSALQGLAPWADKEFAKLGVHTIADLAAWPLALQAEWISDLADFEEAE